MSIANVSLDDKYRLERGTVFLTGMQALARLPMLQHELDRRAGLHTAGYVSGYRGSPPGRLGFALHAPAPFLVTHSWVRTMVLPVLDDPDDPTPYWLVSTRKPEALLALHG